MKENKVISIHSKGFFTKEARETWNTIPKLAQARILENVFCVKCRKSVSINLEKATMEREDLILRGKCKNCGHEVCRLVEPNNG